MKRMPGTRPQCPECGGEHYRHSCPEVRQKRNCANCIFLVRQDSGYSNYTVEETTAYCGVGQHPNTDGVPWPYDIFNNVDRWEFGGFASQCEWFTVGEGPHLDVDREEKEAHMLAKQVQEAAKFGVAAAVAAATGLFAPLGDIRDQDLW